MWFTGKARGRIEGFAPIVELKPRYPLQRGAGLAGNEGRLRNKKKTTSYAG